MKNLKMKKMCAISFAVFLGCLSCLCQPRVANAAIRVVAYNTANKPNDANDDALYRKIFEEIGAELVNDVAKRLDILAVSETDTGSSIHLVDILNSLYGVSDYNVVTSSSVGGDRTGVVYDSSTLTLLDSYDLTDIGTHPILRAHFRPVGYTSPDSEFYVYAVYLKAGTSAADKAKRMAEAANLRSNADALGEGRHIIFAGDFNLLGSSEGAWTKMLAGGNAQAFDVNNCPGEWRDNGLYKRIHTQSTRKDPSDDGLVGGGMDDRFDFQFVTGEFLDGEGLEYVSGSYHVFGNNGSHTLDDWISSGSGASPAVLAALENASDHLPIVADYVFEPIVGPPEACVSLSNNSTPTLCAEKDNVNIPLYGMPSRFTIEATHPKYDVTTYTCPDNWENCPNAPGDDYIFTPATLKLFDNGIWVVWAYREEKFWRPHGMTASRIGGPSLEDTHLLVVSKKVSETSWPQFLVLYADGNLRLIPHPPSGHLSVCFGSSIIIGPTEPSERPIAEISSVSYQPSDNTLTITYRQGGSAILNMSVDRTMAVVTVDVNYPTSELPFTTFRSMFVDEGNCDVARVGVWDNESLVSDCNVLVANQSFGDEFVFYREVPSVHTMSASDFKIRNFFKEIIPDLNGDFRVDLFDYAWLASHWLETNCGVCKGADLTCEGNVDWNDLRKLADKWLECYLIPPET